MYATPAVCHGDGALAACHRAAATDLYAEVSIASYLYSCDPNRCLALFVAGDSMGGGRMKAVQGRSGPVRGDRNSESTRLSILVRRATVHDTARVYPFPGGRRGFKAGRTNRLEPKKWPCAGW